MTMVRISDYFYVINLLLCFCNEIGCHDLQIRQVSGNLADCAVQFANSLCKLARLDGTDLLYLLLCCCGSTTSSTCIQ